MLSPAAHHLLVRRDLPGNLRQRRAVLAAARSSPPLQRRLVRMCREDVLFYVNLFGWQFNPNAPSRVGPFLTYPFQEEALVGTVRLWCAGLEDVLWEKSRELGATWLSLFAADWLCLFHEWEKVLVMSHTEDAVNRAADPDSLFWKLDFMHTRLPGWLARGVWHSKKLGFVYPATNSVITGAATTERSGVGGRGKVLLDEFSKHRQAYEILGQTADTGKRLFIGTHYGVGTTFYDLTRRPDMHKFVMHWSHHPHKARGLYRADPDRPTLPDVIDKAYPFPPDYRFVLDGSPAGGPYRGLRSPWYDAECRRRADSRAVAMHLDINAMASVKQFFDPLRVEALVKAARPPVWEGEVAVDAKGNILSMTEEEGGKLRLWVKPDGRGDLPAARYTAGADISMGSGATNSCFAVIDGDRSLKVAEWADPSTEIHQFAPICVALCRWLKTAEGGGAYFGWDAAGSPGVTFGKHIDQIGYENVYKQDDEVVRRVGRTVSRRPGWSGGNKDRFSALTDYRTAIYTGVLADRSARCLRETLLFEHDKLTGDVNHAGEKRSNDPTGARENHGDLVIATIIAWMLAKDMAAGGRRAKEQPAAGPAPGSLEWLEMLSAGSGRELVEVW